MSKLKKKIGILLVLTLIVGIMRPFPMKALAASAKIEVQDVSAEKGEEIDIPVNISGNPGIMGFLIHIKYDKDVLEAVSVTKSSLLSGQFDDNHDTPGEIKVLWAGTDDLTENGELFSIKFKVLADANEKIRK